MNYNEKQLQIMEKAELLFSTKGFSGTSVRDIAIVAEVNIAMISYYFGSKEKLMEALFDYKIGNIQIRLENIIKDNSLNSFEKINILIEEHIERIFKSSDFYKILHLELMTDSSPVIKEKIKQIKLKNVELISILIKDGQKKGDFKKNVDLVLMLNTMIGTVWQTIMSKNIYYNLENQKKLSLKEYNNQIQTNLSKHIKFLFEKTLTNEQ